VSVKGKSGPDCVFRVTGPPRHRESSGREADRGLTAADWPRAKAGGSPRLLRPRESTRGQAVGLVGEPGIGKSRLLYEFRRALEGQAVTWLEGRCVSMVNPHRI